MNYKIAIFDMDGTILDTLQDLTNSINYAINKNGFPTHTIDEVRTYVGNGLANLVKKACPTDTSDEIQAKVFEDFENHYKDHNADNTKPYDGIIELIKELKDNGCVTAVVSNKQNKAVLDLVDKYFNGIFDYAVGEITGIPRKPAPDSVLNILKNSGFSKEEAVYIGDSDVDLKTATNAELAHIIVTWGFRDEALLRELGAKTIVHSPNEIKAIILG